MHWGGRRLVSASASSLSYRHGDHHGDGDIMFRETRPELQESGNERGEGPQTPGPPRRGREGGR